MRLELPGDDTALYPGMTVKVAFATGSVQRLLIPLTALVQRGELQGLYVVDGSNVRLRQVRSGHRFADSVEILAGLAPGEQYAIDPAAAAQWLARRHDEASR